MLSRRTLDMSTCSRKYDAVLHGLMVGPSSHMGPVTITEHHQPWVYPCTVLNPSISLPLQTISRSIELYSQPTTAPLSKKILKGSFLMIERPSPSLDHMSKAASTNVSKLLAVAFWIFLEATNQHLPHPMSKARIPRKTSTAFSKLPHLTHASNMQPYVTELARPRCSCQWISCKDPKHLSKTQAVAKIAEGQSKVILK